MTCFQAVEMEAYQKKKIAKLAFPVPFIWGKKKRKHERARGGEKKKTAAVEFSNEWQGRSGAYLCNRYHLEDFL